MKILKNCLLITAATGLMVAGISWSHPGDSRRSEREFPISIADAQAMANDTFTRIDTDGNGEVSSAEFAAAEGPRDAKWHGKMPSRRHHRGMGGRDWSMGHAGEDGAGAREARAERSAEHHRAFFEALDSDGNGQLSATEFDRDHQREVRKSLMKSRIFEHMDADDDGVLNIDEFSGRLARLKSLDADDNGEVSRDELRDGMRARHNNRED